MNAKQEIFVAEYLRDSNATRAAKAAGYSEKTAYSQGHDLLKNPEVAQAIADGRAARVDAAIASYEEACARMTEILRDKKPYTAIQACDRLAKLRGWDQPTRIQTQDTTPPAYDLSGFTDEELAAFEAMLKRATPNAS